MVNSRRRDFDHKKRIVVKVGSSTISHGTGKLNYRRMEHLVRELADLQNQGKEMILVSSGATNAGMAQPRSKAEVDSGKTGFSRRRTRRPHAYV